METSTNPKSSKDKTDSCLKMYFLTLLSLPCSLSDYNPHTPHKITWKISSLEIGTVINSTQVIGPVDVTFPKLYFDLCDLVGGAWETPGLPYSGTSSRNAYGCENVLGRLHTRARPFYVCPGSDRSKAKIKQCRGAEEGYCASWGCETTGTVYWLTESTDLISVKRENIPGYSGTGPWICGQGHWKQNCGPCFDSVTRRTGSTPGGRCNPLVISFTSAGEKADWTKTRVWGLRLYREGWDAFTLFTISRQIEPLATQSIGPNHVLPAFRGPSGQQPQHPIRPFFNHTITPQTSTPASPTIVPKSTGERLINLVKGAFLALNSSDPERARDCWLCLNPSPPYYEGIATITNLTNSSSPSPVCSTMGHELTLTDVSGTGLCIGKNSIKSRLCNQSLNVPIGNYYLTPPNGIYWACNTGLTPCISAQVLNVTKDFCVLVQLWPRITYLPSETVLAAYEHPGRAKREPVSITLAVLLGTGGIAAGIATGATALSRTDYYQGLHQAMNEDLQALEQSVRGLKESLTSLSEVVLQNRRGLDLLLLKEGGLCAALKEECCFYADQTGSVTETLDRLRDRLNKRQKELSAQKGWFENMFSQSPWLTTLISAITGPLILLLLLLTIGPCIINRLLQFIKERLSIIQAFVLTSQYQPVQENAC